MNSKDNIYYRTGINASNPFGTAWQNVAGALKQISVETTPSTLAENALIAIKAPNGKYLSTNATDRLLKANGNSNIAPECQFKVLKKDNWFGFKSATAGNNNLQSNPAGTQIKFENTNFSNWEHWTLEFQDATSLTNVKFKSKISNKYLLVSDDNVVSDATGSLFTIEIAIPHTDFPADYVSITPKDDLDNVTVGSKDGKLEIWALGSNDKPYRFNELEGAPYTIPDATIDPWKIQDLKDDAGKDIPGLEDIFATCDGSLFGIRSDDKTAIKYDFTKKQWSQIKATNAATIKLENITASKGTEIFASSEDDVIYKLENNAWKKLTTGSSIAAGIGTDGKSIVIGIAKTGIPYRFLNNKWIPMGTEQLSKITIGNQNYILGITLDDRLVKWDSKSKKWMDIPGKKETKITSIDDVAAIPSGTTVALDKFGNTYHKGSDAVSLTAKGVEVTKATTTTVTTAVADKKVKTATTKKTVKTVSKKAAKKAAKKTAKKSAKKKVKKATVKKATTATSTKKTSAKVTTPVTTKTTSSTTTK